MFTFPVDKQLHFLVGMVLCAMFAPFGLGIALMVTCGVAVLKEVYDHFTGGTVDPLDIFATAFGAAMFILWVRILGDGLGIS